MEQHNPPRWLAAGAVVEAAEPATGWYRDPYLVTGRRYEVMDSDNDAIRVRGLNEPKHPFCGAWVGNTCLRVVEGGGEKPLRIRSIDGYVSTITIRG